MAEGTSWMRHEYCVTRYDLRSKDAAGTHALRPWLAMSDVDRTFQGRRLTRTAYLAAESAYLDVLAALLTEAGVRRLRVIALEVHGARGRSLPARYRLGGYLNVAEAVEFSRRVLREDLWGLLAAPRRVFVHFGYDFLMYVGLARRTPKAAAAATRLGVRLEPMRSPHAYTARRCARALQGVANDGG
jgi:hypothetical protein